MKARSAKLVGVALALVLAALACNLSSGDGGGADEEVPVVVPVFDVATVTPAMGTPFFIPTPTLVIATQALPAGGLPATVINCTPNASWPLYTVQAGDTLGGIAQATGTTIDQLAVANCLATVDLIYVGQQLYVPQLPAAPVATIAPAAAPVIAATVNPTAPQFRQPLTVDQHWYDTAGRPITYNATVRVSAGEVLEADIIAFYVSDLAGTGAILFGQDVDPWDGAFADYTFPAPGTYTFQAVARNDVASANSTVFTIVYDPNFRPLA